MTEAATQTGKITPEAIERLRKRIGVDVPGRRIRPFNEVATPDTMRHFANGYGDDNPLYCDPEYGKKTRWGSVIGPPMYETTMGFPEVTEVDEETRALLKGDPLVGVGQYLSGQDWEFWRPVYPGDVLYQRTALVSVEVKRSEFGGGQSALLRHRTLYRNQRWEPVAAQYKLFIHAEREASAKAGKYKGIERAQYTPEMLAAIDRLYAEEKVRGAEPRYWEDVAEGEELPTIVKGPLLVTDIISSHMGRGWGGFGVAPLKLGYKNRQRVPNFYTRNFFGVPDVAQRCHWEDDWAQALGHPFAYDYGAMRDSWLVHLITNWMGDDAWLWKIHTETRRFNYIGDTHWMQGRVTRKYETEWGGAVDLEIWGKNQRDEITCPGRATVLLPGRDRGRVLLPYPAEEFRDLAKRK